MKGGWFVKFVGESLIKRNVSLKDARDRRGPFDVAMKYHTHELCPASAGNKDSRPALQVDWNVRRLLLDGMNPASGLYFRVMVGA
jgi:hypothetical protein